MPRLKPTADDKLSQGSTTRSRLRCCCQLPKKCFNHTFNFKFLKLYKLYLLHITGINNRAYFRLWNLVNNSLSMVIGFKPCHCAPWGWQTCTETC